MAEPGDEIAAAAGGRGHLRATHADREQVIGALKAAFVQGMLAKDEFDLRMGQAFASRTYADLAAVTADLPAGLAAAQPPEPARESANKKKKAVAALACATPATVGMLFALPPIPDGSPFAVPVMLLMFVLFGAVSTGWLLLFHAWLDERAGRQSAQGLPPGGGGEASRSLAPVDPPGQLPPVNPGQQQTAEAAPSRGPRPPLSSLRAPHRWHPLGRRYAIGYPGH
jgi:hypothetical protein